MDALGLDAGLFPSTGYDPLKGPVPTHLHRWPWPLGGGEVNVALLAATFRQWSTLSSLSPPSPPSYAYVSHLRDADDRPARLDA